MMPESPTEDDDRRLTPHGRQPASHSAQSAPAATSTAGPVSTVVPGADLHRQPAPGDVDDDGALVPAARRERGVGRGAGAGAAGAGLPHAALEHPQPDVRAGLEHVDHLDVDAVGEERRRRTRGRP